MGNGLQYTAPIQEAAAAGGAVILHGVTDSSLGASTLIFVPPGLGGFQTTEAQAQFSAPGPGTLQNGRLQVQTNTRSTDTPVAVRVNGVDRLTGNIPAGQTGIFPLSGSFGVIDEDLIVVGVDQSAGGGGSLVGFELAYEFVPTEGVVAT